jgi:hypothetical protein
VAPPRTSARRRSSTRSGRLRVPPPRASWGGLLRGAEPHRTPPGRRPLPTLCAGVARPPRLLDAVRRPEHLDEVRRRPGTPPQMRWTPARLFRGGGHDRLARAHGPWLETRGGRPPHAARLPFRCCSSSSWPVSAVERSASGADHRGARRRCSGVERGKPRLGAFRRPVTTGMRRARIETTSE